MSLQRTIAKEVYVDGFGFWTGQDVRLRFCPASEDSGIRFFRTDLSHSLPISAHIENRIDKPRQTSLANATAQVDMVEHVLAAVRAAGIDNCDLCINGPEMPGCDGSSRPFFLALKEAGAIEQSKDRLFKKITEKMRFGDNNAWIEIRPSNDEKMILNYQLVYDSFSQLVSDEKGLPEKVKRQQPIVNQEYHFELNAENFEKELMISRTFLLEKEAEMLLKNGLCQRVSAKDVLVFGENGPIDNVLYYENECARHKIIDMIGDFSLSKYHWIGEFYACRTGHQQNANILRQLLGIF
ncbi:MAG: UDP-3-O-acyl-N-acetylglucosamine deacetylase [Planctomycetia bacterium]|nr:UDP-3-O-acyl-N-acetylglucosamine deacetylase [Planctomycetia bacterium]